MKPLRFFLPGIFILFFESCTIDTTRCEEGCDRQLSACLLVAFQGGQNNQTLPISLLCYELCDMCKDKCGTRSSSNGSSRTRGPSTGTGSRTGGGSGKSSGGGGGGHSGGGGSSGGGGHGGGGHGGGGILTL
ncbi:hypothetical protein HGB47_04895 [Leptospira yasudae]|uniref:hypothetical protein n=1 Tax=Leptospira yasudae TaxID=2202201 RepID=UPI001C4FB640|nr:hypothetical protein [Leptospira yasudae]MBW0432949.1 hypothetical protein [Leptospira yasudae]